MSDAILIAGYYRSGTSALSGALHRLGVALHNDAEPNEHNPLGFYEIPELIEFDVDLFARLGVEWTDLTGLPEHFAERADLASYLSRLDEILRRRFGGEDLWGLKHPHLCRLLPIYERAVRQAGGRPHVIHICRDPWTVAASQQRKNGLSRAHALLLWLSYMLDAERHARHLPRGWLTYEALLDAPAMQLRRVEQDLGLDLAGRVPDGLAAAAGFLNGQLNRAEKLPQDDLAPPLRRLTEAVWDAIRTRDFAPALWDGFASDAAALIGLVAEIGASRGKVVPGLIAAPPVAAAAPERIGLRPAERLDEGAKRRLLARANAAGTLPRLGVVIAAAPRRAHAINDTLESLKAQWLPPATITIVSADPVDIPGILTIRAAADAGAVTSQLCDLLNAAEGVDYVAALNAGDTVAPDGCLRFALTAAETDPDLIYCDEIVPNDAGGWIRHKPGWDVTRLRQSAYLGDWVWYRAATLRRLGGFDPALAGAEEYDFQLRLAETPAQVVRLPEAVFTRAALSRRDNIPATIFGPRAAAAVAAHLRRAGIPGEVGPRHYLGLFRHERAVADPGTAVILLCDHADVAAVDRWMKTLLGTATTGRIILAGATLGKQVESYLSQVSRLSAPLDQIVAAVPPTPDLTTAAAVRAALALAGSAYVLILDAAAEPTAPDWAAVLRACLADPRVALAGARALIPLAQDPTRFAVQGPIITGAGIRLGAGHGADDPGPGGWLAVDQEASAVAPPALLARRAALAACVIPDLAGDALWIDLGAQLRARGHRLVWTPDVSFTVPAATLRPDPECTFRAGSPAARDLPWADPYHHPALCLHGNLLAAEPRLGLIQAAPADPEDVLLSGPAAGGTALLNAARALRGAGLIEASWAPEPFTPPEFCRRAPASWVRMNPATPASAPYTAVFTAAPAPDALPAILAAERVMATSPALAAGLRDLAPGRAVTLCRPALSGPVWAEWRPAAGLNTKPRVLWIDEGIEPAWLPALINETQTIAAWIIMERAGVTYTGDVARLPAPADEQSWARELGALAPHILVRPADIRADADHYHVLLAAAAGCLPLVDQRLDTPPSLGAVALPNRKDAWGLALTAAIADFAGTLARGRLTRAAALALPAVEAAPPPWAESPLPDAMRSAAE